MFNRKLKLENNLGDSYFEGLILEWKKLIAFDFYSDPDFGGGVWEATSKIWTDDIVNKLSHSQLETIFRTLEAYEPEKFLPQTTALLSILTFEYYDKKYLIKLLMKTKSIECYNELQRVIDKNFSRFNEEVTFSFDNENSNFCFSQQSDDETGNSKAEKILKNYSTLNNDQAYLLIVSIFGLKYVKRNIRKKLGLLIKTAPRYSDDNLRNVPEYELEALTSLL